VSYVSGRHHFAVRTSFVSVRRYSLTGSTGFFALRNVAIFAYISTVVEGVTYSRHSSDLY
jgi:hypothetical protein